MTGRISIGPCPWCRKGRLRITQYASTYQCDACKIATVGPRRIGCMVPFCSASRGDLKGDPLRDDMEWLCGRHWAPISKRLKRRRARLRRIAKRTNDAVLLRRIDQADRRIWERCKREAIERAGGVG